MAGAYPLEPSDGELAALFDRVTRYAREFYATLPDRPVYRPELDQGLHERIRSTIVEAGAPLEEALELLDAGQAEGFTTASPGFMAYIPGGGFPTAAAADFLATVVNRYVGLWPAAPAMTEIEARTVRWMCDLFGYGAGARGILTSGGSTANFSAVVAARAGRLGDELRDAVLYASDQVHHSVDKAVRLAGLPSGTVRSVARTDDLRMDPAALGRAIAEDRAAGRRPFCVVASAGTTNTGAVDPIDEVADVCEREGLWLHVDGAYGGFFRLTERGRKLFAGIQRADSITLDPHKCMFLPYGTGALIARDGQELRRAHSATADYLQDLPEEAEIPSFGEYGSEFTRDFRGLRVWLPLVVHGVGAFRDLLDEKLDLTRWLSEELLTMPGLEVPWEPSLSVVAFRAATDEATRAILDRVNASGRVFVSSTTIDGRVYIRPCIVVARTHRDRVGELADLIRAAAAELDGG